MNCGACGKTGCRTTQLATVIGDGKPDRRRVCNECAAGGELIVAMKRPVVQNTEKAERKTLQELMAPYIKHFEVIRKGAAVTQGNIAPALASDREFWDGKIEAYDAVIGLLKRGLP